MSRLGVACLAVLALFWVGEETLRRASDPFPRMQAAFRWYPTGCSEAVWKYTGRLPGTGERLAVFARRADRFNYCRLQPIYYVVAKGKLPDGAATAFGKGEWSDLHEFRRLVVRGLGPQDDLYVGVAFAPGAMVFWEKGAWPSAPLAPLPLTRFRSGRFVQASEPIMGPVDVRIEPANLDGADAWVFPHALGRRLGAVFVAWVVLFLAGIWRLGGARTQWVAFNAFLWILFWQAAGAIRPTPYFWHGFVPDRMGAMPFWIGLAVLQAVAFPPFSARIRIAAREFLAGPMRRSGPRLLGMVVLGASTLAMVAFCLFPCRGIYGDGAYALGEPGWDFHSPLSVGLYRTWRVAFWPWWAGLSLWGTPIDAPMAAVTRHNAYTLWLSPVYLAGLAGIAYEVGRTARERFLAWALLFTGKTLMVQFQYLEIYGPALAGGSIAIWLLMRALVRRGEVVAPAAFAWCAYLSHLGMAPLFPLVATAWCAAWRRAGFAPRWFLARAAAIFPWCLLAWLGTVAMLLASKYRFELSEFRFEVPASGLGMLVGVTGVPAKLNFLHWTTPHDWQWLTLGSRAHLAQFGGGVLFIAGPVFAFGLLSLACLRRRGWVRPEVLGPALSAIAFFVTSFFLNSSFPNPKDWDLLSPLALGMSVATAVLLTRGHALGRQTGAWCVGACIAYQVWDTGLWLAYNLTWGPPASQRFFGLY